MEVKINWKKSLLLLIFLGKFAIQVCESKRTEQANNSSRSFTNKTDAKKRYGQGSCDFEAQSFCSWKEVSNIPNQTKRHHKRYWRLSNGSASNLHDHTTGISTGHYATFGESSDPGESGRLDSPIIEFANGMGDTFCIAFWYHLNALHSGRLNVYHTVNADLPPKPLWFTEGGVYNRWIYGQVTVPRNPPTKVVFEAVGFKIQRGAVAVDDISVVNGPCPPTSSCNFEDINLCGWSQDEIDDFDWSLGTGGRSLASTGPDVDHTYGTLFGHFLYMDGSNPRLPGDRAVIETPFNNPTNSACVEFYYHMKGSGIGTLNVWLERGHLKDATPIWSLSRNQGNEWFRVLVNVVEPTEKWKTIFEAIRGSNEDSRIALDDVSLHDGACAAEGDCDFETRSLCGYENFGNNKNGDWVISTGSVLKAVIGPQVDHTSGLSTGHFAYMKSSVFPATARMFSGKFKVNPNFKWCVQFWYHMNGDGCHSLSVLTSILDHTTEKKRIYDTIFQEVGNHGSKWIYAETNVTIGFDFMIIFEAFVNSGVGQPQISLDDIKVTKGLCKKVIKPPVEEDRCAVKCRNGTCLPTHKVCNFVRDCAGHDCDDTSDEDNCGTCSFEDGLCGWKDFSDGKFQWKRGIIRRKDGLAHPVDHTLGSEDGHYLFTEPSKGKFCDEAVALSPVIKQTSPWCILEFWTYQNVYFKPIGIHILHEDRLTLLRKNVEKDGSWYLHHIHIPQRKTEFQIRISARISGENNSIALDDIDFINCSFPKPRENCSQFICTHTKVCITFDRVCDFTNDCGDGSDEIDCDGDMHGNRCDFENGLCDWQNLQDGVGFKRTNEFLTNSTPNYDHSTGTVSGFYIAAYHPIRWAKKSIRFASVFMEGIMGKSCQMRFYYMYSGMTSSSFKVLTRRCQNCPINVIWSENTTRRFSLYQWNRQNTLLPNMNPFQVIFELFVEEYADDAANVAVLIDDISFGGCRISNSSATPTPPHLHCPDGEFYCVSEKKQCVPSEWKCNYRVDCKGGEDEKNCGSCSFENDLCNYLDLGNLAFHRTQAIRQTEGPIIDHTINKNVGFFLMTSFRKGKIGDDKKAILVSPPLTAASPGCTVFFSYYYNSSEKCTMEVGHKLNPNAAEENVLWKDQLKSTSAWQLALIDIGQKLEEWRLFIKLNQPYVAIDDIIFKNCSYGRLMPDGACRINQLKSCDNGRGCYNQEQKCDFAKDCSDGSDEDEETCEDFLIMCNFEKDLCDWHQSSHNVFDWSRGNGNASSSPPFVDHTTGTGKGFYMMVNAANHDVNKTGAAQLMSMVFQKESSNKCNLRFFYHLDVEYGHELTVKRRTINNSIVPLEVLWRASGVQSKIWNHAVIDLRTENKFQVVIEAKLGSINKGVIAIDDVSFPSDCKADPKGVLKPEAPPCEDEEFSCGDGECIQNYKVCNFIADCKTNADESDCPAVCDFEENDPCRWHNAADNTIDWSICKGRSPSNDTGPPFDHTKRNMKGHFLYIEADQLKRTNFPMAQYVSPLYKHGSYHCNFTFFYNMFHNRVTDYSDAILNVLYRRNEKNTLLWTNSATTYQRWANVTVRLPRCPKDFHVVLVGRHYWNTKTDIAVDDWSFDCADKPPLSPCNDATEFTCKITKHCVEKDAICDLDRNCCDGSDEWHCKRKGYTMLNFENGLQDWTQLKDDDDFDFDFQSGRTDTTNTGPYADHTYEEDFGKYIYTEASKMLENQTAKIVSPTLAGSNFSSADCPCKVRFWYNMYGDHMGNLTVCAATEYGKCNPDQVVWSKEGNQGVEWHKGGATICNKKDFQLIFIGMIGSGFLSDLAIDDISFTPGCKFTKNILPDGPTPPPINKCAPLLTCKPKNNYCIEAYKVCDFENDCSDNIDESASTCGYPEGFENSFGAWTNSLDDQFDFTRHQGPTTTAETGPSKDARGDSKGYYIYLEASGRQKNNPAILNSPWYQNAYSQCILTFSYSMYGVDVGIFRVSLQSGGESQPTDLLDLRGNIGKGWKRAFLSIGRQREPFYLSFIATVGSGEKGDIGIDEINLLNCTHPPRECNERFEKKFRCKNDYCVDESKLCDFVDDCGDLSDEDPTNVCASYMGCNFDNTNCNLTQDNSDDFDWTLHHGQTLSINTGPTHDHTLKSSTGNYMYIEASHKRQGKLARLNTLPMKASSEGKCILKFYYHMVGKGLGSLKVYVKHVENVTLELKANFEHDSGFMWKQAVIDLSEENDTFRVVFEGIVGTTYQSDIAIDDIIFGPHCLINGSNGFPEMQPCRSSMYPCKNSGNCVPHSARCNRSVECKDGTDEDGCFPDSYSGIGNASSMVTSYISAAVSAIAIFLLLALISVIVSRKRRTEKFHLFSIFYDPTHQEINQISNRPKEVINSVANPAYDECATVERGSRVDLNLEVPANIPHAAVYGANRQSHANPMYQEPFSCIQ